MAKKNKPNQGLAIAGLIINIFILPGLGSIIGGATKIGIIQVILFIFGILITLTLIGAILGIPLMIAMWIWGIVTGVKIINEAG